MQHLARHTCGLAIKSLNVRPVGQQSAFSCNIGEQRNCRNISSHREVRDQLRIPTDQWRRKYQEALDAREVQRIECLRDVGYTTRLENLHADAKSLCRNLDPLALQQARGRVP